jgi:hypothetical protein
VYQGTSSDVPHEDDRAVTEDRVRACYDRAVATLNSIVPCFIVENLRASLDFYQSKLGFEIAYKGGGDGDGNGDDFWAFVRRDGVMISFKAIALRFIRSRIIRATNGRAGTPTSTPPTPTRCTKSTSADPFRCTSLWQTPRTACAPSR